MDLRRSAAIAIGAAAGAGIRWALTRALGPGGVDAALLVVNLTGVTLLGLLTGARPGAVDARTEALLGAGFCGALTTWSSLALHTATEFRAGSWIEPSAWLTANLVGGVALAVGARRVSRRSWNQAPVVDQ
jgi:CrcB protein